MARTLRMLTISMPDSEVFQLYDFLAGPLEGRRPRLQHGRRVNIVARLHQVLHEANLRGQL